ncbi:MAG: hypothetical protein IPL26_24135 [Leptospiraceae bacterium]|nr:hypothetical protein [Leptospiraceae bacterium]
MNGTETPDFITISSLVADFRSNGGVLASKGKIYELPRSSTDVLIINPKSNGT